MKEKNRLGRGLGVILGESAREEKHLSVVDLELDLLSPNRFQPRRNFDRGRLHELAESIKSSGVVQPILVRRIGKGYEIVTGERRWRAAQMAGLPRIPAIVKDLADSELLATALVENVQRDDLNPLEIAMAFSRLKKDVGLSQAEIAERVGIDRASVSNHLRLLTLPESIKRDLSSDSLTMGHAKLLLTVSSPRVQRELADLIIKKGLSVRHTESIIRNLNAPKKPKFRPRTSEMVVIQDQLCFMLGTKVTIARHRKGGGKIQIEYYSDEDLDRIFSLLKD